MRQLGSVCIAYVCDSNGLSDFPLAFLAFHTFTMITANARTDSITMLILDRSAANSLLELVDELPDICVVSVTSSGRISGGSVTVSVNDDATNKSNHIYTCILYIIYIVIYTVATASNRQQLASVLLRIASPVMLKQSD